MANQTTQSVTINVTLTAPDTTPPTAIITQPATGNIVSTTTPVIRGTASDNVSLSKVEVSIDGGIYSLASGTSTWSFTSPTLSQGSHSVTAKATDASGNPGTSTAITFTVDTTAPTVVITSPTANQSFSGSTVTGVDVPVSGTASDGTGSGVALIEVSLDGGAFAAATGTTSWSRTVHISTGGSHSITVRATDGAVNTALYTVGVMVGEASDNVDWFPIILGVGGAVLLFTNEGKGILNRFFR